MPEQEPQQQQQPQRGLQGLLNHAQTHKLDCLLWFTRVMTIYFALSYFIPIFTDPYSAYYKALMANGATSALRLHMRIPSFAFSRSLFYLLWWPFEFIYFFREFLGVLFAEDSAHYLFFSLIFMWGSQPMTVVLMPVTLFAVLHAASYSLTLLDCMGSSSWWGARMLISFVELHSRNILRMVAFSEIFLMPLTIFFIFVGKATLVTPFMYYRFLGLR